MSYERLTFPAYDPHFSLESVSYHTRSWNEFETYAVLAVKRAVEHGPADVAELGPYLLKWATDTRMLRWTWERQSHDGGQAPGPNGRRYSDLASHEVWSLLKAISISAQDGKYKPQPAKRIWVPKDPLDPERGDRPISLINVEDRVLQRAIKELILPLRDPDWDDLIFGSRPNRSRFHALAHLERLIRETGRWVFIIEDVRDAFESVPRNRFRDVLKNHVPSPELVDLILRLIHNGRKHGTQQGGPLSPLVLIEYLDHFLIRYWRQCFPEIPLLCYVDDLLAICKTQKEAKEAWQKMRQRLLAAGMQIKAKNSIRDLRKGERVEWLGFSLSCVNGSLHVAIATKCWSRLQGKLLMAHEESHAPLRANEMIKGWVDQLGPSYEFENRSAVLDRIFEMAASLGFDEIPSRGALRERWRRAHQRWLDIRHDVNEPPAPVVPLPPLPLADVNDSSPPFDVDEAETETLEPPTGEF